MLDDLSLALGRNLALFDETIQDDFHGQETVIIDAVLLQHLPAALLTVQNRYRVDDLEQMTLYINFKR